MSSQRDNSDLEKTTELVHENAHERFKLSKLIDEGVDIPIVKLATKGAGTSHHNEEKEKKKFFEHLMKVLWEKNFEHAFKAAEKALEDYSQKVDEFHTQIDKIAEAQRRMRLGLDGAKNNDQAKMDEYLALRGFTQDQIDAIQPQDKRDVVIEELKEDYKSLDDLVDRAVEIAKDMDKAEAKYLDKRAKLQEKLDNAPEGVDKDKYQQDLDNLKADYDAKKLQADQDLERLYVLKGEFEGFDDEVSLLEKARNQYQSTYLKEKFGDEWASLNKTRKQTAEEPEVVEKVVKIDNADLDFLPSGDDPVLTADEGLGLSDDDIGLSDDLLADLGNELSLAGLEPAKTTPSSSIDEHPFPDQQNMSKNGFNLVAQQTDPVKANALKASFDKSNTPIEYTGEDYSNKYDGMKIG